MTSALRHPSNRLYNGECRDFRDAVETYISALEYEAMVQARLDREYGTGDDLEGVKLREDLRTWANDARDALREYDEFVAEIEKQLFQRWAAGPDGSKKWIGSAALDGDFSQLAI